jgi:5'(3')-deoxyribonucleotidase
MIENREKEIVYIDMDNVVVDFVTGIEKLPSELLAQFPEIDGKRKGIDDAPGIFSLMDPYPDSIDAVIALTQSTKLDVYLLSTAPWNNPSAWSDKLKWVHDKFDTGIRDEKHPERENHLYKRLILSHNKHRNAGAYLIDDRLANGARDFKGKHIHFGEADPLELRDGEFPTWLSVLQFFCTKGLLEATVVEEFARKHKKLGE